MHQDPAFQCGETAKVEHHQREPFIGNQDSMRRQRFLTIDASLHGSEDILEVLPHPPGV
jgi:hypothetical protein